MEPQFWEESEKIWHFQRVVFVDSLQDYHHIEELYNLVYKPDQHVNVANVVRQQHASKSNRTELALLGG